MSKIVANFGVIFMEKNAFSHKFHIRQKFFVIFDIWHTIKAVFNVFYVIYSKCFVNN